MTQREAYAILGISSREEAKSAMRKLAMIHHPDKGGVGDQFQVIMDAYRLVMDRTYRIERLGFGKPPDVREGVFSSRFVKALRDHGCLVYVMTGSAYMAIGMPDLYFCHPWLQGWVELKVENGKLKDPQRRQIAKINKLGGFAIVARHRVQHGIVFENDGAPVHLLKGLDPKDLLQALLSVGRVVKRGKNCASG